MLSSTTKSHQLVQLLEAEIAEGRLGPGDAVPSQNELARIHGVAVGTVRDAFSALEHRGLLQRVQGKGTFVTEKALQSKVPEKTGIFAVLFQEQLDSPLLDSPRNMPFYQPVFRGMETVAQRLGVDICICVGRNDELPRLIREHGVDGVIVFGHAPDSIKRIKAFSTEMPVVVFHSFSEVTHCVMAGDHDAGRQATEYLLSLGHRRIAFLSVDDLEGRPGRLRLQGYRDTMHEHGISVRDEWVDNHLWMPNTTSLLPCKGCDKCAACIGWETMKAKNGITARTRELPFTAMICHNDATAMGLIAQARADGFEVPRDFSVIGFDNVSRNYHFKPQITSIDFSLRSMGEEAVQLLGSIISDKESKIRGQALESEYVRLIVPANLALHETTQSLLDDEAIIEVGSQVHLTTPPLTS
jgi:DNA-binding LacI/PurR family transcriptional regulator